MSDGSPRKRELLEAAYAYALAHGLSDLSLRPLAQGIGTSPRVLLYLFGSKDGLTRALLARSRQDERAAMASLGAGDLVAVGRELWGLLASPAQRPLLVLWVEGYSRSLRGDRGPWADFARATVHDWLELLTPYAPAGDETEAALLLAVLRGGMLDLLATGDEVRTTAAVERHLAGMAARFRRGPDAGPSAAPDAP
ncbi:MAG TPA: TetR family transcriptional regulator [Acidimicrobiales bacterium]|nr:TetR family transcriptional regulator [Acidimicrobiales bacterium]